MGKKASTGRVAGRNLDAFVESLRAQLANRQRLVRAFDIGGSGVKTALFSTIALRELLHLDGDATELTGTEQLEWIERPMSLGEAPGERGFSTWLRESLPRLQREVEDPRVCFGVSVGGDVIHETGAIGDWWPAGGHPRQWDDGSEPLVAEIMGLPPSRTFVLHDGEAHLLGCSRSLIPPPNLICLAVGSGVGHGISDSLGAVVDPSIPHGERSHQLNGVPLSGAAYKGIWKSWLEQPGGHADQIQEVIEKPFANMNKPWRMPWVSLVLGRRGMELAEAAHGCPRPLSLAEADAPAALAMDGADASFGNGSAAAADPHEPAARAYSEQWLHFLHTQLVPQFCGATRRHRIERLCFAGGVTDHNWPVMRDVLFHPGTDMLKQTSQVVAEDGSDTKSSTKASTRKRQAKTDAAHSESNPLTVLPSAPHGSGLIGAGLYALAGMGGASGSIWSR